MKIDIRKHEMQQAAKQFDQLPWVLQCQRVATHYQSLAMMAAQTAYIARVARDSEAAAALLKSLMADFTRQFERDFGQEAPWTKKPEAAPSNYLAAPFTRFDANGNYQP